MCYQHKSRTHASGSVSDIEVIKYVEELEAGNWLKKQSSGGKLFYSGKHKPEETLMNPRKKEIK